MPKKLKTFNSFVDQLLPIEIDILLSVAQFKEPENTALLNQIANNVLHPNKRLAFDENINKRRYSNLKTWIEAKLDAKDVDRHYKWLQHIDEQVMCDTISPNEEKELISYLRNYSSPDYYFMKLYQVAEHYRSFLLIRVRHEFYEHAQRFLNRFESAYKKSMEVHNEIQRASVDIVNQYIKMNTETRHWVKRLQDFFYDENLDGFNRYMAAIRLIFIYYNYREFEKLIYVYDYLDDLLKTGNFYSRRIIANYYGNRLMLHSRYNELEKAERYGYLSLIPRTIDYVYYLNNLCSVLLRQKKSEIALKLMRSNIQEMRKTQGIHTKVNFVALYVKCLNDTNQPQPAESFAESFLNDIKEELFEYRWHFFFVSYLEALALQGKYKKLVWHSERLKLLKHDEQYRQNLGYLPTLYWQITIGQYKEGLIQFEECYQLLKASALTWMAHPSKVKRMQELIKETSRFDLELGKQLSAIEFK